jgi:F0F1-type ATP synthase epsilon subunit
MNYKMMIKNVAMSTLLLSAVAGPQVFADSAKQPVNQTEVAGTAAASHLMETVKLENAATTTFASKNILDPVKLAETYAPDTVEEWKSVLEQYNNLTSKLFLSVNAEKLEIVESADLSKITNVKSAAGTISFSMKALTADEAKQVGDKMVTLIKAEGVPLEVKALDDKDIVAVEAGTAIATNAVSITAATAVPVDGKFQLSPFAQGWTELDKAVNTKDATEIKQALSKHLELYKQEIVALEKTEK